MERKVHMRVIFLRYKNRYLFREYNQILNYDKITNVTKPKKYCMCINEIPAILFFLTCEGGGWALTVLRGTLSAFGH